MTVQRPQFAQNLGNVYTAEELRRFLRLLANRQPGVNASGDFAVTQNGTPNMSVNVAAGEALVLGTETSTQGAYYAYNDATVNRTVAASDPTNPRRDLVVVRIRDAFYSTTFNDADVVVVTGTPAPSPLDPAAPADSLILARVAVAANATTIVNANITDLRVWQAQKLVPGTAGWHLRDSGDANDNISVADAGLMTLRNALQMPASAGGTVAPSAYGSVPVKIGESLLGASAASVPFTIPSGFRNLKLMSRVLCDQGTVQDFSMQLSGNTTGVYNSEYLGGGPGTTVAASQVRTGATSARIGVCAISTSAGGYSYETTLMGINVAAAVPQYTSIGSRWDSGTGGFAEFYSGQMGVAGVVTSMLLFPAVGNFAATSLFTLYGWP